MAESIKKEEPKKKGPLGKLKEGLEITCKWIYDMMKNRSNSKNVFTLR